MSSFTKFSTGIGTENGQSTTAAVGTKHCLLTGQSLVSSGVPSLDAVLNGGLPRGSLVLLEQDERGQYAGLLMRYFMAEGVCSRQPVFVAAADTDPRAVTAKLPAAASTSGAHSSNTQRGKKDEEQERMKIAWRYQNMSCKSDAATQDTVGGNSSGAASFGRNFDLSRHLSAAELATADICHWGGENDQEDNSSIVNVDGAEKYKKRRRIPAFVRMVRALREFVASQQCAASVCRAVVLSLGAPLWMTTPDQLLRCCHLLRTTARQTRSVVMVSVPADYLRASFGDQLMARLRCAADVCLSLRLARAIGPSCDYHGMLVCHRLSSLHALAARPPSSSELVFKARRCRFSIEPLHLPPDLSDTASRSQQKDKQASKLASSAGVNQASQAIDF